MKAAHREVVAYLRSIGAEDVRIEAGGKHPRVVFTWKGRQRHRTVSGTPSTPFSADNAIHDLRRVLGLLDRGKHVGARRKRKARAPTPNAAAAPAITALPDWHDDLPRVPAEELNYRAWHAWRGFWRDCMQSVGAVSLL